jgi:hypothetical protein
VCIKELVFNNESLGLKAVVIPLLSFTSYLRLCWAERLNFEGLIDDLRRCLADYAYRL